MSAKPTRRSEQTIASLSKELADPSARIPCLYPKEDWWFPAYVPAWARMLSRQMYMTIAPAYEATWIREDMVRRLPKAGRGRPQKYPPTPAEKAGRRPGRPLEQSIEDRIQRIRLVQEVSDNLKLEGKRSGDTAALRLILNQKDVNKERVQLIRDRKLYKIKN